MFFKLDTEKGVSYVNLNFWLYLGIDGGNEFNIDMKG